ncbi:MAG: hypothetical protein WB441_05460 [Nocardioidaceae bacterium]
MVTTALRSLSEEPGAEDTPERVWRHAVLIGVAMVTALLEGALRARSRFVLRNAARF